MYGSFNEDTHEFEPTYKCPDLFMLLHVRRELHFGPFALMSIIISRTIRSRGIQKPY